MRMRPAMFLWSNVEAVLADGEVRSVEAMVPLPRFRQLCLRQFAIDEQYALGPVENVPNASRGGFFAAVRDAWDSLPEDDARFPHPEFLRKRALVHAGWATHTQFVMDTPADAAKMARGLRKADEYAVIKVGGNVVDLWTAKSIAAGAITAEQWREVKPRALDYVSGLAGTTRGALEKHSKSGGAR